MKTLGDSHLIERGNSLKNNNIFLRIKQFNQENKCNLYKKTIFLYRIAVALRMECVDLSAHSLLHFPTSMYVALRMECVDLSPYGAKSKIKTLVALRINRTPHGVCKIKTNKISPLHLITVHPAYVSLYNK